MENTATSDRIQRDYELVCAARDEGNRKAYADLMAAYREPLYTLLLRMTRNTVTADDLTMETFVKAFMQLHRYSPTGTFSSWLYAIGVNTYIDHLRRQRLQTVPLSNAARDAEGDAIEYQIPSNQPNPEEALIRMERDEALKAIVAQLKEPYRVIVQMRYYEDMSYEEIATKLQIPMGTLKIRLMRSKELLAATVKERGGIV